MYAGGSLWFRSEMEWNKERSYSCISSPVSWLPALDMAAVEVLDGSMVWFG